jgi:hypothetical protein
MNCKKLSELIKRNKIVSGILILAVLFVLVSVYPSLSSSPAMYRENLSYDSPMMYSEDSFFMEKSSVIDQGEGPAELKVKEGSASIKSKKIDKDSELLRELAEKNDGYIEQETKTETEALVSVVSVVRVPFDNFDSLIKEVQESFDVRDYQVSDFRIGIQRQIDELSVIEKALQDYSKVRQDALLLRASKDQIEILVSLTEKELYLVSQQKMYQRDLSDKERRSSMATLIVTLDQQTPVKLWPEDLGNRFRELLQEAFNTIVMAFMAVIVNSLVLIVKLAEYLVYLIVIAVPAIIIWKQGDKIYKKFNKQ